MAEPSGNNNPRAQRGKHASQPVEGDGPRHSQPLEASNNPRHSQPVGTSNNPRHSQPVGASNNPRHSKPLGEASNNPRYSQPVFEPNPVALPVMQSDNVPLLGPGEENPFSRTSSAEDYAKDRRRKKRRRIGLGILVAFLLVAIGGIGAAWAYINGIETEMNREITPEITAALEKPAEYDGGTFYMLLMGTDKSKEREEADAYGGTYRSDSMILTRVDPKGKKITMVSLHRDTEIEIAGYGKQKLNASYAIDGPASAIKTVSQMAGVPISHYAEINFDGFKDVVDALGGVEVDVPMEINDELAGGHVDAGLHALTGEEALILCRSRHAYDNYGDGDRYRAANQRLVLSAIAKKILQSDLPTMTSTIESLSQYITTDFKIGDILALANSLQGLNPAEDIYSAMEPTISEYKNDTWYEQLDTKAWNAMMNRVKQGLPPTEEAEIDELNGTVLASVGDGSAGVSDYDRTQPSTAKTFSETRTGKVTIKNGNGIDGCGAEALARIEPLGYTADASNANSFNYDETVIVFNTPDQRVYAEELIDALGCGRAVQNQDNTYVFDGDFLILIGADWH